MITPSPKPPGSTSEESMTKTTLDQDDQDILEAFEAGEFQSALSEARRAFLAQAAEETCKKDKRSISAFPARVGRFSAA